MKDLIERQAAIEAAGNTIPSDWFDILALKLETLPSVTPEQKKGKWITSDDLYETGICSYCGYDSQEPVSYVITNFEYCPNCGARMMEVKDETDRC